MELLVTLRKRPLLEKVLPLVDGVIVGEYFTTSFHLNTNEIRIINNYCKANKKKIYVVIDNFISEDEKADLKDYLGFINSLDVDGIYFHDLGIYTMAKEFDLVSKLIYDGKSVLCNSLDTRFMLHKGIDSVMISRELTLEEIKGIAKNNPRQIDVQLFGHLRMSYSKRKFLKNYFREIDTEYDYLGKETMYLIEEKRDYKMPIVEDENGTYIYTDYIVEMSEELVELRPMIKRGIIDTIFIDDENLILEVCREYRRIGKDNAKFIKENLRHLYPENYDSGYLYQKTNITKDE